MTTMQPLAEELESAVAERFLALLCEDKELLRTEFAAIIAASWSTGTRPPAPGSTRSRLSASGADLQARRRSSRQRQKQDRYAGWLPTRQRAPP